MPVPGASEQISQAMLALEGVTQQPHRFGGQEYRLGRRELGHIHGDHLVDIPFPRHVRDEVVAAGLAQPHHLQPDTGWISLFLRHPEDVDRAISLLERSYQMALAQRSQRTDKA